MASAAGAARARTARAPGSAAAFAPGEGGEWRATDVAGARRVLGRDPFTVPGLGTISVETGDVEGEPAVRVRQSLESGGEIVLVQTRGAAAAPRSAPAGWVTVARGNVTVAASAALDEAALRALLERLR